MIALAIVQLVVIAGVSFLAFRAHRRAEDARTEASAAALRARDAEAERDEAQEHLAVTARQRDLSLESEQVARAALAAERVKRNEHHEENAKADAPGGGAAVDAALDRLRKPPGAH